MKSSLVRKKRITSSEVAPKKVLGKIFVHPKGFGFVRVESQETAGKDVFIPKKYLMDSIDEDIVAIEISQVASPKGPEGKVLEVVERTKNHLPGLVTQVEKTHYDLYLPTLGSDALVTLAKKGAPPLSLGARILVSLRKNKGGFTATFLEKIGHVQEANSDTLFACFQQNIARVFPRECLDEVEIRVPFVTEQEKRNRINLTHLKAMTIDPPTAKDFDDALSIEIDERGNIHLGVHIADAAHYVKPGSALDAEAKKRANSTYFPRICIPMLPEFLSNGLCSLQPDVERLSVSVLMEFNQRGVLEKKQIVRSVIQSKKRWTYQEALSCIEENHPGSLEEDVRALARLARLLKEQRAARGCLDFSLQETSILVDAQGEPTGIVQEPYDSAHQLVEEFMLKANELVAEELSQRGDPALYRIHQEPQEDSLRSFAHTAQSFGFSLPDSPEGQDLQSLFQEASNSPHLTQLSLHFIRAMNFAHYAEENIGHYGLHLEEYTHFTSPIRRYADLLVQRMLFQESTPPALGKIAEHLSDQERRSMKAENQVVFLKKLRLLQKRYEENPRASYSATLTSIRPYMIFFEVQGYAIEGSLHVSQMHKDYFIFDPKTERLLGQRTGCFYVLGGKIAVRIAEIDLIFEQIRFSLAP